MMDSINVYGAGLAGSEAAWQAARRGVRVRLFEMKPKKKRTGLKIAALALASANAPDFMWRTMCDDIPGSPVIFPQWAFPELRNPISLRI